MLQFLEDVLGRDRIHLAGFKSGETVFGLLGPEGVNPWIGAIEAGKELLREGSPFDGRKGEGVFSELLRAHGHDSSPKGIWLYISLHRPPMDRLDSTRDNRPEIGSYPHGRISMTRRATERGSAAERL